MKKEALRVSTAIPVAPTTLYFAWLDSEQHSAMTGGQAKIQNDVGQKFSACGGYVTGKLITLDLGRRIIMSWRTSDFPRDAGDSRAEIHLEALGGSTRVTVLHTEIPEGQSEKYRALWNDKYFTPMRAYFSKYLPDPRKPPPVRKPLPPPEDSEDEEDEEDEAPKGKRKLGAKAAPSKAAPPKAAPSKAAPSKAAPPKAAPSKAAPPKAAPSKAAPSKAAPPKAAPPKAAPSKAAKPAKAKAPAKAAKPTKAKAPAKAAKPAKAPAKAAKKAPAKKPAKPAKKKR